MSYRLEPKDVIRKGEKMELGTVVYKENIPYVITKITNGQVNETVKLEDYITKNVFIKHQGEYKTLRNIIEMHCKKYLSTHEAIERN